MKLTIHPIDKDRADIELSTETPEEQTAINDIRRIGFCFAPSTRGGNRNDTTTVHLKLMSPVLAYNVGMVGSS